LYPYPLRVRCARVRVWCLNCRPEGYPCPTLVITPPASVSTCAKGCRDYIYPAGVSTMHFEVWFSCRHQIYRQFQDITAVSSTCFGCWFSRSNQFFSPQVPKFAGVSTVHFKAWFSHRHWIYMSTNSNLPRLYLAHALVASFHMATSILAPRYPIFAGVSTMHFEVWFSRRQRIYMSANSNLPWLYLAHASVASFHVATSILAPRYPLHNHIIW
jgi:hypothetical protein